MKTFFKLAGAGALLTATLLAQRPFGVMTSSTPPDPATIVAHKVERLTKLLGLSTSQQGQATTIFLNALNDVTPLESTLKSDRQSLQTAVKANDTATIDSVSASIGTTTGQIVDIQNKADAAFYAILTPSQQNTLNQHGGFNGGHGHGWASGALTVTEGFSP